MTSLFLWLLFRTLYIIEFVYAKNYIFLTVRCIQLRLSSSISTSFVMLPQFLRLEKLDFKKYLINVETVFVFINFFSLKCSRHAPYNYIMECSILYIYISSVEWLTVAANISSLAFYRNIGTSDSHNSKTRSVVYGQQHDVNRYRQEKNEIDLNPDDVGEPNLFSLNEWENRVVEFILFYFKFMFSSNLFENFEHWSIWKPFVLLFTTFISVL